MTPSSGWWSRRSQEEFYINMITREILKNMLHYDAATGLFYRLTSSQGKNIFDKAGCLNAGGYVRIIIAGKSYVAHRLAWLYMTGEWVTNIDHKNGVRNDNRWGNLRDGRNGINQQNIRRPKLHNKSGLLGAYPNGKRFMASIRVNKRAVYIGTFDTPELAHAAYVKSKRDLHPGCTI